MSVLHNPYTISSETCMASCNKIWWEARNCKCYDPTIATTIDIPIVVVISVEVKCRNHY